jgi:hypothetical protein
LNNAGLFYQQMPEGQREYALRVICCPPGAVARVELDFAEAGFPDGRADTLTSSDPLLTGFARGKVGVRYYLVLASDIEDAWVRKSGTEPFVSTSRDFAKWKANEDFYCERTAALDRIVAEMFKAKSAEDIENALAQIDSYLSELKKAEKELAPYKLR